MMILSGCWLLWFAYPFDSTDRLSNSDCRACEIQRFHSSPRILGRAFHCVQAKRQRFPVRTILRP